MGGLFLRENSSNGGEYRQNFLAKSYEPKKQGVKGFLDNKRLCFQQLKKLDNTGRKLSKMDQSALPKVLKRFN